MSIGNSSSDNSVPYGSISLLMAQWTENSRPYISQNYSQSWEILSQGDYAYIIYSTMKITANNC